jgi:predicted ATPase
MSVITLAVTGGPCAGKTTVMDALKREFQARGYRVFIVPEAATILAKGGYPLSGPTEAETLPLQLGVSYLQFVLENVMRPPFWDDQKTLLICDRGIVDNKAYMSPEMWGVVLGVLKFTEPKLLARYDAVLHLQSAAVGAVDHYKQSDVRTESVEQAARLETRTLDAWADHPRRAVVHNDGTGFASKVERAVFHAIWMIGEASEEKLDG